MTTEKEKIEDYEESIIDIDEIEGTDIKINPDYYIHHAILKAQTALTSDNIKEGFEKYVVIVNHAVMLCTAANRLPADFKEKLKRFKDTDDYKEETGETKKLVSLATKKFELILAGVFSGRTITQPLRIK